MKDGRRKTEDDNEDDKIDVAIGRAVREMLDVEPPADLRARVVFQIEHVQRKRGSRTAPALLWIAAGAVVAILFAARLSWQPDAPGAPTTVATVERTATPPQPAPGVTSETPGLKPRPTTEGTSTVVGRDSDAAAGRDVSAVAGRDVSPVAGRNASPVAGRDASPVVGRGFSPGVNLAAVSQQPERATTEIEPLRSIAPIQLTPILQNSIAPAELAMQPMKPLSVLEIAPLSPPDRRN